MSKILFVKTRHHYKPYDDFYRLAGLAKFGFCYEDEIEYESDRTYICNHFAALGLNPRKTAQNAQIILWQTEHVPLEDYVAYSPDITRFWHMDAAIAERYGHQHVVVGSHPDLPKWKMNHSETYDICMLSYISPNRERLNQELRQRFNLAPSSAWDMERDRILYSSRMKVHIHQHNNSKIVPGFRMAIAAAYRIPIMLEDVYNRHPFELSALWAYRHNFITIVDHWLKPHNRGWITDYVDRLYQQLCVDDTFKRVVERNV